MDETIIFRDGTSAHLSLERRVNPYAEGTFQSGNDVRFPLSGYWTYSTISVTGFLCEDDQNIAITFPSYEAPVTGTVRFHDLSEPFHLSTQKGHSNPVDGTWYFQEHYPADTTGAHTLTGTLPIRQHGNLLLGFMNGSWQFGNGFTDGGVPRTCTLAGTISGTTFNLWFLKGKFSSNFTWATVKSGDLIGFGKKIR